MRNILLLEPPYKNKYPPIGLMKIATYHRKYCGDHVQFFKDTPQKVAKSLIAQSAVKKLCLLDPELDRQVCLPAIESYIGSRKISNPDWLKKLSISEGLVREWLAHYAKSYHCGDYEESIKFDRVYVSTLFTFHWDLTVKTINDAKRLVKDTSQLIVGGVMASVAPDELEKETGIKPIVGLLDKAGQLDETSTVIIDELPLDYSILDETDYKYPASDAFYGYMTRGCVRSCKFCAVPLLEPEYKSYIPLKTSIAGVKKRYGDKQHLLLLDNNVLASGDFAEIIKDIRDAGFHKGASYTPSNLLQLAIQNIQGGYNVRTYTRQAHRLIFELQSRLKDDALYEYNQHLLNHGIRKNELPTKEILLDAYKDIADLYEKYRLKNKKLRSVDFNQGIDARLVTEENMRLLGTIAIKPLRIAFDTASKSMCAVYSKAVRLAAKNDIKVLSNYLLYNYQDRPIDLYRRLKINIDLAEELEINIFSFPMKYNPINDVQGYFKNRDFLGKHWNRKYIRTIQAVLNATKGKIGRRRSFFEAAFGKNENEFLELLYMPEEMIIYREHFKENKMVTHWRRVFRALTEDEKKVALPIIHTNKFEQTEGYSENTRLGRLFKYYRVKKSA